MAVVTVGTFPSILLYNHVLPVDDETKRNKTYVYIKEKCNRHDSTNKNMTYLVFIIKLNTSTYEWH
jgi:hypothetical protein